MLPGKDVDIRIKATDEASQTIKKVDQEFGKLDQGLDNAGTQATGFAGKYGALLTKLTVGIGIVTAAGTAMKTAFDLAEQGAAIDQTSESFDLLIQKVGAAPDLLDQLSDAAGGTLTQLDLMRATTSLLAGASGDLATRMAEVSPRLLEIARAAGKLNPTLGDTAFLYDSIAIGIKRASPLILDNLGLTIKIGEANTKYAELLGKTVEQLTAEEQKMALLNATLEAGQVLIDQVGGTTESAVDPFKRLTTAVTEMGNAAKIAAFERIGPFVEILGDLATAAATGEEKQVAWNNAILRFFELTGAGSGSLTTFPSGFVPPEIPTPQMPGVPQIDWDSLVGGANISADAFIRLINAGIDLEKTLQADADAAQQQSEIFTGGEAAVQAYADRVNELHKRQREMMDDRDEALQTVNDFSAAMENLQMGHSSPIAAFIGDLRFLMAGGAQIATIIGNIKQALEDGLSPEDVMEATTTSLVASLLAEIEIGQTDFESARQVLVDALSITPEEATAMLTEFETAADAIAAAERELKFAIIADDREGTLDQLERLFGPSGLRDVTVHVDVNIDGELPDFSGSGSGGVGQSKKKASGGPVWAGQSYLVGEQGPEMFVPDQSGTIIPNGQTMNMLNTPALPPIIVVMLDGQEISGRVSEEIGAKLQQALSSGAGYTGM